MWTPGSVLRASDSVGHPGLQSAALADKCVRLKSYDGQLGTSRLDINEGMNGQRGRQEYSLPPPAPQTGKKTPGSTVDIVTDALSLFGKLAKVTSRSIATPARVWGRHLAAEGTGHITDTHRTTDSQEATGERRVPITPSLLAVPGTTRLPGPGRNCVNDASTLWDALGFERSEAALSD